MTIFKKLFQKDKMKTQVFEISLKKIETLFEKMEDQAGWDMSKDMYWTYYFLDHDQSKIKNFANELKNNGYDIIDIITTEIGLYRLQINENTTHTPKLLIKKFQELASFANEYDINIFDGWEVGKLSN